MRRYCATDRLVTGTKSMQALTSRSRAMVSGLKYPCSFPSSISTHTSPGRLCRRENSSVLSRSLAKSIFPIFSYPPWSG